MSYTADEPIKFDIAYYELITILISIAFFIFLILIGVLYFNFSKRKAIN